MIKLGYMKGRMPWLEVP